MSAPPRLSLLLAGLAGWAAAVASLLGFVPGLYRDRPLVVAQSHGYDAGNLVAVAVLVAALTWAARGSLRGRLVALGALGCLLYDYVTYAFVIVLNPATFLYIAVLGLGGWSLATGLARVDPDEVQASVGSRMARRTTAAFLVVAGLLFAVTWLSQMLQSALSGRLPVELVAAGWPMNPVYVLDLGFVIPLLLVTGVSLVRRHPGGARFALPLLVFIPLLAASILLMAVSQALDGQAIAPAMVGVFAVVAAASASLAGVALRGAQRHAAEGAAAGARPGLQLPG